MEFKQLEVLFASTNKENLGRDIHKETAADIFNKPVSEVTDSERKYVKNFNYLDLYSTSILPKTKELK